MRIAFSRFIESDLDAIADYIARDNPDRAFSFIQEIREKFRTIATNPLVYRLRPEFGREARMAFIGNYVVLFRVFDERVRVERVVYGGRDLAALFDPE